MTTNYQQDRTQLDKQLNSMLPPEIMESFDKEAKRMQANFKMLTKIGTGEKAPDFTLPNVAGRNINLYQTLSKHAVVLVFYRGEWCPYCNLQLSVLQKDIQKIKEKGAAIIAISPQNPDSSLTIKEKHSLEFEVLSDPQNKIAREYTTVFRMSDEGLSVMKNLGYDFDSYYTDDSKEIPVPAVFVIAKDRTVLLAKSEGGDYRNRVETAEIINVLRNNFEVTV